MLNSTELAQLEVEISNLVLEASGKINSDQVELIFSRYGINDANAMHELWLVLKDKYKNSDSEVSYLPLTMVRAILTSKHLTIKQCVDIIAMLPEYVDDSAIQWSLWDLASRSADATNELYTTLQAQYHDLIPATILHILCVNPHMTPDLLFKLISEQALFNPRIIAAIMSNSIMVTGPAEVGVIYDALKNKYQDQIPINFLHILLADQRTSAEQAIDMLITQQHEYEWPVVVLVFNKLKLADDPNALVLLYQKLVAKHNQDIPRHILQQLILSANNISKKALLDTIMTQTSIDEEVAIATIQQVITSPQELVEFCRLLERHYTPNQMSKYLLNAIFNSPYITAEPIIALLAAYKANNFSNPYETLSYVIPAAIKKINDLDGLADFYAILKQWPQNQKFTMQCLLEICRSSRITEQLIADIINAHNDNALVVSVILGNNTVMTSNALMQKVYSVLQDQYHNNIPGHIILELALSKQLSSEQLMTLIKTQSEVDTQLISKIIASKQLSNEQIIELIQTQAKANDRLIMFALSNVDFSSDPLIFTRLYEAITNKYPNDGILKQILLTLLKSQKMTIDQIVELTTKQKEIFDPYRNDTFFDDVDNFQEALVVALRNAVSDNNQAAWDRLLFLYQNPDMEVLLADAMRQVAFNDLRIDIQVILDFIRTTAQLDDKLLLTVWRTHIPFRQELCLALQDRYLNQHEKDQCIPECAISIMLESQNITIEQITRIAQLAAEQNKFDKKHYDLIINGFLGDKLVTALSRAVNNNPAAWDKLLFLYNFNMDILPLQVMQRAIFADPRIDIGLIFAFLQTQAAPSSSVISAILRNPNPELRPRLTKMIEDNNQDVVPWLQSLSTKTLAEIMQQEIQCSIDEHRMVNEELARAILTHRNTDADTIKLVLNNYNQHLYSPELRQTAERLLKAPQEAEVVITDKQEVRKFVPNRLQHMQQATLHQQENVMARIMANKQQFDKTVDLALQAFPPRKPD